MENIIVVDSDKKRIAISDQDDVEFLTVSEERLGGQKYLQVYTEDFFNLTPKGATALRDFLNQYLVGYE